MNYRCVVFIHNSPFQVLNALEYFFVNGIDKSEVLFILSYQKKSASEIQLRNVLKIENVPNENILHVPYENKFSVISQAKKILNLQEPEIYLVSVMGVDISLLLPSRFKKTKVVFFDEGTMTLGLKKKSQAITILSPSHSFMGKIKSALLGLKSVEINEIFSSYEILSPLAIHTNEYLRIKKNFFLKNASREVWFLGQHIYKDMHEIDIFFKKILELRDIYQNDFIYFPHRHDSKEVLSYLSSKGVEIRHLPFNIEYYATLNEKIPKLVLGFTTSALWSLRKIFDEVPVDIQYIPLSFEYFKKNQENYRQIYDFFEEKKMATWRVS